MRIFVGGDETATSPRPLGRSIICSTPAGPRKLRLHVSVADLEPPEQGASHPVASNDPNLAAMANRIAAELEWYTDHIQGAR